MQWAPALFITGTTQNDVIEGGPQNDTLYGKAGDDTLRGPAGNDDLYGGLGSDTLEGGDGNDLLLGYEPYSTGSLEPGHDTLYGGRGADRMFGGLGDDVYLIHRGDGIDTIGDGTDVPAGGFDTLRFGAGVLPEHVAWYRTAADLRLVLDNGPQQIVISGFFNDTFDHRIEQFIFDNGNGAIWTLDDINAWVITGTPNAMLGTSGDDRFSVDHVGDTVSEAPAGGTDTIESWVSYTLPSDVENLILTGPLHIDGTGNALDNVLRGNSGSSLLDGAAGYDTAYGGAGDDVYKNIEAVVEDPNEGIDTWVSHDGGVLPANVENLSMADGSGTHFIYNVSAIGNTLDNRLTSGGVGVGGDILDGREGADTMIAGGSDSPIFVVDNVGDRVIASSSGGSSDKVISSISYQLGPYVENLTLTGADPISGTGNDLNNTLDGSSNSAANVLAGGKGDDTYIIGPGDTVFDLAGEGNDTLHEVWSGVSIEALGANLENVMLIGGGGALNATGNELDNRIQGDFGDNTLSGEGGNDTLIGSGGNDTIAGGAGNDTLDGGEGEDLLDGGSGDDSYLWGWASGKDTIDSADAGVGKRDVVDVNESSENGFVTQNADDLVLRIIGTKDQLTIRNYFAGTDPTAIEEFRFSDGVIWTPGDVAAKFIRGSLGNDTLVGTAANDNIAGLAGDDTVSGGAGHDILRGNEGADMLNGEAGADTLMGGGGADLLDGGPGGDTLVGGTGDDTYIIDDAGDVVIENADEGVDTVKSSVSYTLAANVENLVLTGTGTLKGTGNALNNALTGNSAKNFLAGGAGNDVLDGGSTADTLRGGAGDDSYVVDNTSDVVSEKADEGSDTVRSSVTYTLAANLENLDLTGLAAINGTGNALNNILTGNSANNTLDGGIGSDTLAGYAGNDTYVVDDPGDMVIENASEGTDTVKSNLSYVLGAHLEHLVFTGTAAVNGTGNGLGNTLTGNSADNTLSGGAGADTLIGNAGNDYLDGGTEADQLKGGAGNDTYIVDAGGDVVTEKLNEGVDTVQSAVTFTLGANVENLVLTGTAAINGTGNGLNNVLMGNSADNTLKGGTGADTAYGGAGNDLYIVDNSADSVVENPHEGVDSVHSSVTWTLSANTENLTLTGSSATNGTGNALDNMLTGNSAINALRGEAGNDVLDGKAGADKLYGGSGDDTYIVDNTGDVVTENPGRAWTA
ncbi:MAG: calcium-binding protein [Gammaproteobacteria bacterium]